MAREAEIKQLQDQIAELQRAMSRLDGTQVTPNEPEVQTDHVEHGSDRHAGMLMLKKAREEDKPQLDGWALEDIVSYGPTATQEFLEQSLRQKVNELKMKIPETQSSDPLAPHFAQTIWQPGQRLGQITE